MHGSYGAGNLHEARELLKLAGFAEHMSLAIIGTEKNAGKTSTLNHLISAARKAKYGRTLALTSIGRDGESRDLVNQGEKPRIYIAEGSLLATSTRALKNSDALLEIRDMTGIPSAFGEIVIVRAKSDGYVELAGPSQAKDLRYCERLLRHEEPDCFYIVDGALSRRSSAGGGLTESLILALSLGDARSYEAFFQAAKHAVDCLLLPALSAKLRQLFEQKIEEETASTAIALQTNGQVSSLLSQTLLGSGTELQDFVQEEDAVLLIRGALTDSVLGKLFQSSIKKGSRIVVEDGSRVFLSRQALADLYARGFSLEALYPLNLRFVSFNPRDRYGQVHQEEQLLTGLREILPCPVLNLGPCLCY